MPDLSIVIPLYNEEPCVAPLVASLDRFLEGYEGTAEVILVDDGSSDGTRDRVRAAITGRPGYRLVELRANRGQTLAMVAGLESARGDIIVTMDGDLQNDPADIPLLLEKIHQGHDLVTGWRRDRKDRTLTRKIPSRVANWIIGKVTGVKVHDYGCSLKAYRSELVRHLNLYSDMHRFLPALCWRAGARVTEVPVRHHARTLGSSKYGLNRIFKVVADLLVIKLIVSFSDRPMHYFGALSLLFLTLAVVVTGFWGYNLAVGWQEGMVIFPAVAMLLFCCAVYFLFIGLLADMVIRVGGRDPSDLAEAALAEVY